MDFLGCGRVDVCAMEKVVEGGSMLADEATGGADDEGVKGMCRAHNVDP